MYDMSGSLVFRSGVGTQMFTVSISASALKSVVARSFSRSTRPATSALGTSGMYDVPRLIASTLRASRSMPVVSNPLRANSTASGRPT